MSETPSAPPVPATGPEREVRILDIPATRVRRPGDLVMMLLSLLGIAVVLVLSVYAHGTTMGVTEDVQSVFAQTVRGILLVPINIIEGLLTLILPIIVVVERRLKRNVRAIGEALGASLVAFLVALGALWLLQEFAPTELTQSLLRLRDGETNLLAVLFQDIGKVVPKVELLERAWGADHLGDPNVVEVYVGRLRRKLDVPFDADDIETIRGVGYRLRDRPAIPGSHR